MNFSKPSVWVLVAIGVVAFLEYRRRPHLAIVPKNDANPPAPLPPIIEGLPGAPVINCIRAPCPGGMIPNRRN